MKQIVLDGKACEVKAREREYLGQVERAVPWAQLVVLVATVVREKSLKVKLSDSNYRRGIAALACCFTKSRPGPQTQFP